MMLKLGLVGDNINRSVSPRLHALAGQQAGIQVRYDRLIPKALDLTFDETFAACGDGGYRGINITYPYKEQVVKRVRIDDPLLRAMGTVNTVIFEEDGPRGYSTDYSGFMSAYRSIRGMSPTGPVLMIGTGGVGRAVAFGLAGLGTRELRLVDRDRAKAEALAAVLHEQVPDMAIDIHDAPEPAAQGACGLINCSPVGMVGYEGTPLGAAAMTGAEWAFDAVYTPVETQFLKDAAAQGLSVLSGWELFFYQGLHAWGLFSGAEANADALRAQLLDDGDASP